MVKKHGGAKGSEVGKISVSFAFIFYWFFYFHLLLSTFQEQNNFIVKFFNNSCFLIKSGFKNFN